MCNSDCSPRRKTHDIPNSGTDGGTIDISDGVFIWDIIVAQGGSALASTVTLAIVAPGLQDLNVLSLAAGKADDNASYAVMRQGAAAADGDAITGTAVPFYIPSGGLKVTIGGSGIAANTATITVVYSESPPPWR